jgi:hypothetical protein
MYDVHTCKIKQGRLKGRAIAPKSCIYFHKYTIPPHPPGLILPCLPAERGSIKPGWGEEEDDTCWNIHPFLNSTQLQLCPQKDVIVGFHLSESTSTVQTQAQNNNNCRLALDESRLFESIDSKLVDENNSHSYVELKKSWCSKLDDWFFFARRVLTLSHQCGSLS